MSSGQSDVATAGVLSQTKCHEAQRANTHIAHELATNAAKYGSLSRPTGTVHLKWTVGRHNSEQILTVTWRERGGPPAQPPTTSGFGTTLIATGIPNATVASDYGVDGFSCTIQVSLVEPAT